MQDISLNDLEKELFQALKTTLESNNLRTTLRVAGGWVRDKLLGLESHDIDITLDDMMGEAFANLFTQAVEASSIGKIKANPEASKHLETACVRFKGVDIDFVNLRAEDYSADSRIPSIKIGSPLEDALRRDLTINSLFYNINEGKVEDLTNCGLQDLADRVARTPLDPLTTFKDDPLRILRTIRFAARFQLRILPEVSAAIHNEQVLTILKHKISRERIYKEFSLMVKGNNHMLSLAYLASYSLIPIIFAIEEDLPDLLSRGQDLMLSIARPRCDSNLVLYSSALLVFYALEGGFAVKRKKRDLQVYEAVCEDLKMTNFEVTSVCAVVSKTRQMMQVVQSLDLAELAELIRSLKENWKICLIISAHVIGGNVEEMVTRVEQFVEDHQIGQIWHEKPLLNGNEIKTILNVEGKRIGEFTRICLSWQVLNRAGTKLDLIEYLRAHPPA